jgi:pyruvate,water dikinase
MQAINCRLQDLDFSRMSLEELGRRFATDIQDGVARFDLLYAVLTTAPLAILYKVCERWLGDTGGTLANSLLADTGDMASAQAGIDLGRLAAQARAVPPVRDVLLSEGDWHILREKLLTLDEGRAFLRSWDRFMACHGHHCRGELEFYNPRWSEMPDYLLKLVRGYLVQTDVRDPRQDHQERTRRREQLWEQCRRQLRNPVKRMIFDRVLRAARSGSVLRENFKNEGIRWTALLRRMLLEIGVRLAATGVLQEPDDVFFLQLQELDALLHGGSEILGRTPSPAKPTPGWQRQAPACRWFARSPSAKPSALPLPPAFPSPQVQFGSGLHIRELIAARRAEYERNRSLTPPKVVVGRFDPDQPVPEAPTVSENAEVLHGVAASAGMATGQARVILRAETDEHVQAGEILVAPFTDPGWTPYFVPAAGIVTDQGGLLSHGSIIAREYGIPAVVNVPAATRIIKTGQRLRVDGNRGLVTILP